jgi:hypothetical protein
MASERVKRGIANADEDDIFDIVVAAIRLEKAWYAEQDLGSKFFTLRKALEGIWGHDLPDVDENGDDLVPDESA